MTRRAAALLPLLAVVACGTPRDPAERLLQRIARIEAKGDPEEQGTLDDLLDLSGRLVDVAPEDARAWTRRAELVHLTAMDTDGGFEERQARLADAERAYRRALELAPNHEDALVGLAALRLEHDGPQTLAQATALLEQALQGTEDPLRVSYMLGIARFRQGDYARAEQALKRVAEQSEGISDELIEARRYLGRIYTDQGRFEEAERTLQGSVGVLEQLLLESESENGCPFQALGRLYAQTGRPEEAARLYERAADQSGQTAIHLFLAGLKAYERGNHAAASAWLDRAESAEGEHPGIRDPRGRYHTLRGYIALATQDFDEAGRRFDAAQPADPVAASVGRGHVALARNDAEGARRGFAPGLSIDLSASRQGLESTRLDWLSFTWRMATTGAAWADANEGQHERALAGFDRVLAEHAGDVLAALGRANSLLVLGRAEQALAAYEQVLKLSPGNAYARSGRADALAALGRAEEAEAEWRAVLDQPGPAFVCPHKGLGLLYLEQGRTEEAAEQLGRAVAIEPELGYHKFLALARIRRDEGRTDEATALVRQALRNRPDGAEARRLLEELGGG